MTSIITCSHVDLGYDGHVIVKDLNMKIEQGAYVSVIGQNGSGKSTFIKTLLGLVRPVSGKIQCSLSGKGIGYLPQQTEMQKNFPATALEVVLSGFLSRKQRRPFYKELNKNEGIAILMVSHDLSNALKDADEILHIRHEDYFFGSVSEYRRSEHFREMNGGAVHGIV